MLTECADGAVAVLEADHAVRADFLATAQLSGVRALGFSQVADLLGALHAGWLRMVIVSDSSGRTMPELLEQLRPHLPDDVATVFIIEPTLLDAMQPSLQGRLSDFVVSPYTAQELWTRVVKLLSVNPCQPYAPCQRTRRKLVFQNGRYTVNPLQRSVSLCGTELVLPLREFDLAYCLFEQPGRIWSRSVLCQAAWGQDLSEGSRKLDTYMSRLRTRLQLNPANGWKLTAVYGSGYRLDTVPLPDVAVGAASAASMSPANLAGASCGA